MENKILSQLTIREIGKNDTLFIRVPDDTSGRNVRQMRDCMTAHFGEGKVCIYNRDLGFSMMSEVVVRDEWGRESNPL